MHMHSTRIVRPTKPVSDTTEFRRCWTDCTCTAYCVAVAPGRADGKTPNRVIRIDDETWAAYLRVCDARGISRSDAIRMNIKREIAEFERDERRAARERADAEC
jgi:hypothetical protein